MARNLTYSDLEFAASALGRVACSIPGYHFVDRIKTSCQHMAMLVEIDVG